MRQYVARPGQECKSDLIVGAVLERVSWTACMILSILMVGVVIPYGRHSRENGA